MNAWNRFLLPSVSDLIFVLLVIGLSTGRLPQKLLGDAGIGWHIRTGELILATHSVPRVDSFSSTMSGKPWYAWEWLYDVLVGAIHHAAGLNGVVFFSAVLIALTFALVFRMMLARGASLGIAVVLLLLSVCASSIHFLTRPHLLSWLFTLIAFVALDGFETDSRSRRLHWLPLIMLVWVNLHGGFLVGFVLQGIYLITACAGKLSEPLVGSYALGRTRALLMTGVLMLVATFANPYGYKLHAHIYLYLSDPFLMNHIDEFLSPNFHGLPQKCFALLVLLSMLGVAIGRTRLRTTQALVVCFAVYTGLYASRNIPVSSMLLALIMAPIVSQATADWVQSSTLVREGIARWQDLGARMKVTESRLRGHAWAILVVVFGMWICLHQGRLGSRTVMNASFDGKRFPVQAVDFLARNHVREPVFCPDTWGGYLIYRLYPRTRVVVDDRHDLYGAEFLKDYLRLVRGEEEWDRALSEMQANWVLVPKVSALASLLEEAHGWKHVYHDETAVLFQRVSEGEEY